MQPTKFHLPTAAFQSTLNATKFKVELTLTNVLATEIKLKEVLGLSPISLQSSSSGRKTILENAMLDHAKAFSLHETFSSFNKELNEVDNDFENIEQLQLIIRQRLVEVHQQAQNSMNFPTEIEVTKHALDLQI